MLGFGTQQASSKQHSCKVPAITDVFVPGVGLLFKLETIDSDSFVIGDVIARTRYSLPKTEGPAHRMPVVFVFSIGNPASTTSACLAGWGVLLRMKAAKAGIAHRRG